MKDNIKIPLNEHHRKNGREIYKYQCVLFKAADIKSLGKLDFEIIKGRISSDVLLRVLGK